MLIYVDNNPYDKHRIYVYNLRSRKSTLLLGGNFKVEVHYDIKKYFNVLTLSTKEVC